MIRKSLTCILVLCALLGTQVVAQTVDELVRKNMEARGGAKNLEAIKSIKQTGKSMMMGMEMPLTIYIKRPGKVRNEIEMQGMHIVSAYDGEEAWMVNPMMGAEPQKMPKEQAASLKDMANIGGLLSDYKENGYTVGIIGEEEVRGKKAYKLIVKDTDDNPTFRTL